MNPIDEKASMLSRAGSFYSRTVSAPDRKSLHKLSHISCNSRVFTQIENAAQMVLSGGYVDDHHRIIHFNDRQIIYYGLDKELQARYSATINGAKGSSRDRSIHIPDTALPTTDTGLGLAYDNYGLLLFPSGKEDVVLSDSTRLDYGLVIDPNIYVTTIEMSDGTLLMQNIDFRSRYGFIAFRENPVSMFPGMKLMAKSCTVRKRNIYSYTLGVDDVYGPVDRIMTYYRRTQTPKSLYLASAQAAGMPVVRNECRILSVAPLHYGWAYMTTDGRYDAAFPHNKLGVGTTLKADTVIGGSDLYELYGPNDPLPKNLDHIDLDSAVPVRGLSAPNSIVQLFIGNVYQPVYTVENRDTIKLEAFWRYVRAHARMTNPPSGNFDFSGTDPFTDVQGRHLQVDGTPVIGADGPGGSPCLSYPFHINEKSDYGSVPGSKDWSVAFWFRIGTDTVNPPVIILQRIAGGGGWAFMMNTEHTELGFSWWDDKQAGPLGYSFKGTVTKGVWHHVAAAWEPTAGKLRLYMDGNLELEDATLPKGAINTANTSTRSAKLDDSVSGKLSLSDIGFWQGYALQGYDIAALYNGGAHAPVSDTIFPHVVHTGNAMRHFLSDVVANRYILVRINKAAMTSEMRIRLLTFLDRERPLGSVLIFSPLDVKITG